METARPTVTMKSSGAKRTTGSGNMLYDSVEAGDVTLDPAPHDVAHSGNRRKEPQEV